MPRKRSTASEGRRRSTPAHSPAPSDSRYPAPPSPATSQSSSPRCASSASRPATSPARDTTSIPRALQGGVERWDLLQPPGVETETGITDSRCQRDSALWLSGRQPGRPGNPRHRPPSGSDTNAPFARESMRRRDRLHMQRQANHLPPAVLTQPHQAPGECVARPNTKPRLRRRRQDQRIWRGRRAPGQQRIARRARDQLHAQLLSVRGFDQQARRQRPGAWHQEADVRPPPQLVEHVGRDLLVCGGKDLARVGSSSSASRSPATTPARRPARISNGASTAASASTVHSPSRRSCQRSATAMRRQVSAWPGKRAAAP